MGNYIAGLIFHFAHFFIIIKNIAKMPLPLGLVIRLPGKFFGVDSKSGIFNRR